MLNIRLQCFIRNFGGIEVFRKLKLKFETISQSHSCAQVGNGHRFCLFVFVFFLFLFFLKLSH